MNSNSRVFKTGANQITQAYKKGTHNGIDLVKNKNQLDYIVAHSDGEVVAVCTSFKGNTAPSADYGNYVKIKHNNGYYTLYAHMAYNTITVKKGDKVTKGQVIGYMGNTGNSYGAHLHFEVRNTSDTKIDPTAYINADLPGASTSTSTTPKEETKPTTTTSDSLKVGDKVKIIKTGKASSYGTGLTAGGIGWTRYITKIHEGKPYPYQVGLKGNTGSTATTGFYKADALTKLK